MPKFEIPSLHPPAAHNAADRRLRLVAARGGAELASMGTAIGAIYCAEKLTPEKIKSLKSWVAKAVVTPQLERFDWLADKMPGFEGKAGIEQRKKMPPDIRAQYFADGIVDYSLMAGGAVAGQTAVQWLLDHMMGLHMSGTFLQSTRKMALATTADRGIQLGAMALLTAGTPDLSEKMQHSIAQNVLKRLGVKDDKVAEENARYFVTWQIPNLAGWAGSLGFLDKVHAQELRNQQHIIRT